MSGNTKQVIQDYDTVFDNSIPFRKNLNDLLRITYFRIPGVPGLHFVPWHRGSGCLGHGAAAPVTGAAADEYNLNVVDCNASVTVARRSSTGISVSGGWGVPPAAGGKRKMVFRGLPRACWEFLRLFALSSRDRSRKSTTALIGPLRTSHEQEHRALCVVFDRRREVEGTGSHDVG